MSVHGQAAKQHAKLPVMSEASAKHNAKRQLNSHTVMSVHAQAAKQHAKLPVHAQACKLVALSLTG